MMTHRLPKSECSAAVPTGKPELSNLLELAARLRLQRTPWPVVAHALDVDVETIAAWRKLPAWRVAYARAAQPFRSNVAKNLEWVAGDPANPLELAAAMYVVAADLCDDERAGLWWTTRALKPGVFNWNTIQPLIHRERRRADLGPGWERAASGKDVDFEDGHADQGPDPAALTVARDSLERLQRVSTKAQWRAVERLRAGQKLTNADYNAIYHLRRRAARLGLKAKGLAP
jgi:hypothetical protein